MTIEQKEILESNRLFHNKHVDQHDKTNSYIFKNGCKKFYEKLFLQIITKENAVIEKSSILELGCGTGNFLEFLLTQNIGSYAGIDVSEKMIDRAKEKFIEVDFSTNIGFYKRAAEDFIKEAKVRNKKFDVIFSFSFLHHLFDTKIFLRDLEDVLSPGGVYIALHEPNTSARNKPDFAKYIDARLSYFFGYDTLDSNFLLRIKKIVFYFLRILSGGIIASLGRSKYTKDLDYIDYQLNFVSFNPLEIIDSETNQNIRTYTKTYGYFVFDWLKRFSKFTNNYFYLVIKNKNIL